jgi:hypothetical protein
MRAWEALVNGAVASVVRRVRWQGAAAKACWTHVERLQRSQRARIAARSRRD